MELDRLKLLEFDRVDDDQIRYYLKVLADQGGGWGYKPTDCIILTLAEKLAAAEEYATKTEEFRRNMKGSQLENGRLKKQVRNLQEAQTALLADLEAARAGRQELAEVLAQHTSAEKAKDEEIKSLEAEIKRLQEKLDK